MAGKKGQKLHANKTSYPNQKGHNVEPAVIMRSLKNILKNTKEDDDILSWQDACMSIGIRRTKLDYWCDKIPVFSTIKKEIYGIVAARVNKKALKGKFNATASIWRMKQSGEKDESTLNQKSEVINYNAVVSKEEAKKISDDLENEC